VPDPADPATPSRPPRPRRSPKFVLPEHHQDERAAEHIEAFLDGPVAAPRRAPLVDDRIRRPVELETRPDWMIALRLEGARHARYGRPASVLLIELQGDDSGVSLDGVARTLADVIRAEARETDRAVRVGASSFRLLLPETGARAARTLAERLDRGFAAGSQGPVGSIALCIEVATASRTGTLEDALSEAERRLLPEAAR
jgi:GGDEF domain-containing protein